MSDDALCRRALVYVYRGQGVEFSGEFSLGFRV